MKLTKLKEQGIWIAPVFIALYVFFLPLSSSLKSVMAICGLFGVVLIPYYRSYLWHAFNTGWARAGMLLFFYVILACFWSAAPFSMQLGLIDKYSKLIYLPVLAAGFIHPKTRQWVFNAYFISIIITCLAAILKYQGIIALNNPEDPGEIFYNHIVTGYMVAVAVYFAGLFAFREGQSKWHRAFYVFIVVLGSYHIFFLNTGRTGYITYALLMVLLLLQKLPLKKAIVGCFLLCAAIGAIYSVSPLMQIRTAALISDIKFLRQNQEDTSLGFRVQFHEYAKSLFLKHPVQGIGTGNFKYSFSVDKPIPSWEQRLHDPHSQYWLTLTEQGIIGFAMLLMFIGSLFIACFKLNKETRPFLLGVLITFVLGSFTDTILCYSPAGSLLIIISSLSLSELLQKVPKSQSDQQAIDGRNDVLAHAPNQHVPL